MQALNGFSHFGQCPRCWPAYQDGSLRRRLHARDQDVIVPDGSSEFYASLIIQRWGWLECTLMVIAELANSSS
jgi:hypothetical protein